MGLVTWPHYHHICAWLVLVILHTQVCSSYYTHRSVPVIDVSSQMCMHAFMQLHRIARSNIDAQYMFIDNKCSRCSQLRSWSTNIWFCRRRVIWDRNVLRHNWQTFCLIEVRAMVVVLQQPLAECTATSILPMQWQLHKTHTDQQWNGFQDSACIQDQRSMCWQHITLRA